MGADYTSSTSEFLEQEVDAIIVATSINSFEAVLEQLTLTLTLTLILTLTLTLTLTLSTHLRQYSSNSISPS